MSIGLLVAFLGAPFAADLLFETSPRDPLVLGSVGGLLLAVGLLSACGTPVVRALRIPPTEAMRDDI